ncbi:putative neural-cadherin 2 [Schistocerca cancellata]|uniref:putative neural-cadherin 2 n=1 Tax=Schistocerca cancellata TaxID=274614 RepID=UPI0021186300|nr:putative neural-cadherin 2 [Schistocerca cancellata]
MEPGTAVRYELAAGNDGDAFSLHETSGQLRVAGPLDYEVIRQYELQVAALDGSNLGLARVQVRVVDVNDCAPVFERPAYRAQVTEEDDRGLPKRVLQYDERTCTLLQSLASDGGRTGRHPLSLSSVRERRALAVPEWGL